MSETTLIPAQTELFVERLKNVLGPDTNARITSVAPTWSNSTLVRLRDASDEEERRIRESFPFESVARATNEASGDSELQVIFAEENARKAFAHEIVQSRPAVRALSCLSNCLLFASVLALVAAWSSGLRVEE